MRTLMPVPRNAVRTSARGSERVPVGGDDDHLVRVEFP